MTKVIPYEEKGGPEILEFKTSLKGKPEKFIGAKDWKGDHKELRKQAERIAPLVGPGAPRVHRAKGTDLEEIQPHGREIR